MARVVTWVISRGERGQTATEYVLMTAVAASIALGVAWLLLEEAMQNALTGLGTEVAAFFAEAF